MKRGGFKKYSKVLLLAVAVLLSITGSVTAETVEYVSVSSNGDLANGVSGLTSVSGDGRYIAFLSLASNLVPGDTNGKIDIFVRDRLTGITERVSTSSEGLQGNNDCRSSVISADGRYVAFYSLANNLVPGDTNVYYDTFVHDRLTGITELVSKSSSGAQGDFHSYSDYISISADGRYVAFASYARNLVPNDTNGNQDVFVHDRLTGVTEMVSVNSDGIQGDWGAQQPDISSDGRYVSFASNATNWAPFPTNSSTHVYVHDRQTGTTERVSVSSDGTAGDCSSSYPAISGDGRYVVYHSCARNLVPGDTYTEPNLAHVYLHDRQAGITKRLSRKSDNVQEVWSGTLPSISSDGRYVVFPTRITKLSTYTTLYDLSVYDLQTDTISNLFGGINQYFYYSSISGDGSSIAFEIPSSAMFPGSGDIVRAFVYGSYDYVSHDTDNDGILDDEDNCPAIANADQADNDGDGQGDVCDADDDADAILDVHDNCPFVANFDQADQDGDQVGDVCDPDIDGDTILNTTDNCPLIANADQSDLDGDGLGDACDPDDDNDGVLDVSDNCPLIANADQGDLDADGLGDVCDPDDDNDGVADASDNCPFIANSDQNDFDGDGLGDVCDADVDNDGVLNTVPDQCEFTPMGEAVDPATGCSVDQYVPCDGPMGSGEAWRNHGGYVSTLAQILDSFVEQGLITQEERDAMMAEGAQSGCGN